MIQETLVVKPEQYNTETMEFVPAEEKIFTFEHSLLALAKWEMRYRKPFLIRQTLSGEELVYYYQCMAVGDVPPAEAFTVAVSNDLQAYIASSPTATVIHSRDNEASSGSYQTSETIYAMMAMAQVPFECETWNLNRLIMLLGVISERNKPQAKRSKRETVEYYARLNEERRKKLNSKG